MNQRVAMLSITVVAFVLMLSVGCQPAGTARLSERTEAPIEYAIYAPDTDGIGFAAPVVQRGEGRVHLLLARSVDLPVEVNADRVRLGAGDALGEQMFERYASVVRNQQRQEQREFVQGPGSAEQIREAEAAHTSGASRQRVATTAPSSR